MNKIQKRTRNRQFAIRISDNEEALYALKQREAGLNKTDFFIEMLNDTTIKVYQFNDVIKQIYRELQKIGVNLNQIAATANRGHMTEAEYYITHMQKSYDNVMDSLKKFLEAPMLKAQIIKVEEIGVCYTGT